MLDELLAARPDLHGLAETCAARLLSNEDRSAVASEIADTLRGLDIEELNGHAGYRPGHGYVHPVEAAAEILDEALEPFLHDLERRASLGMTTAAAELAVGILLGLYQCRDGGSDTLLEYSPDYATEHATQVVNQCAKLGIELPSAELLDLVPHWSTMLR
ncbi:MAG: hypothetical protein ABI264_10735 [Pseudonocardiaceae bacterium]